MKNETLFDIALIKGNNSAIAGSQARLTKEGWAWGQHPDHVKAKKILATETNTASKSLMGQGKRAGEERNTMKKTSQTREEGADLQMNLLYPQERQTDPLMDQQKRPG